MLGIVFFFIISLNHGAFAAEPSLRFIENPQVAADRAVYLRDIAQLTQMTDDDRDQLGSLKIADTSEELKKMAPRDVMRVIRSSLRAFESRCECKLTVTLPHALTVMSLAGEFHLEKVQTRLRNELMQDCKDCEFDISPLHVISGTVPETYASWNVDVRRHEWRGPSMIRVYFDDQTFTPLVLQTLVKIKRPVLKLNKSVAYGESISATDFDSEMIDVTYDSRRIATLNDIAGTEVRRSLAKGSWLTLEDLVARHSVRLGQPVAVEMQKDAFSIHMDGVAQKNGRVGEKIPVKILKTQKNVLAEVISEGRVRF